MKKVLVACEYSAMVRDAFREQGHDAWSCDILETEGDPKFHIIGDVLPILDQGWDLMVGHPPCTFLSNSGVRWLHERTDRWPQLFEGADFFKALLDANIPQIAIENPVMHKYGVRLIGKKHDQTVQPWMFGDNETKAVCLWLKNLPELKPEILKKPEKVEARVWKMAPGPERQKERSRFFKGIADAMAKQWGAV